MAIRKYFKVTYVLVILTAVMALGLAQCQSNASSNAIGRFRRNRLCHLQ
jgi:hypothetical protein